MRLISRAVVLLMTVVALAWPAQGQQHESSEPAGGPFTDDPVLNAPFSADAITTVRENLPDGRVREQIVTAHYSRDSQGRVHTELDTAWGPYVVLWVPRQAAGTPGPQKGDFFDLDPAKRIYWLWGHSFATLVFNAEGRVALPVARRVFRIAPRVEGTSKAERLRAVNAELSPDLGVVVSSHRTDEIGSVEYRLTNIRRVEPPPALFGVPPDYTRQYDPAGDVWTEFRPWNHR